MVSLGFFERLHNLQQRYEARLLLHEAELCPGDDICGTTMAELRDRIAELSEEISAIQHRSRYVDL